MRRRRNFSRPSSKRLTGPAFLILAVTTAAYANSFSGVLVFDDEPAIASNPHIRRLLPLKASLTAPPDTTASARPAVSLSLALNYALAPADARDVFAAPAGAPPAVSDAAYRNLWGYHLFNLTVHALAALVLFGIVRRTLQTDRMRDRFGNVAAPLAMAVALLWAVHPVQTSAVTYVIQRAESLMGLFYLLTLYSAIRAHGEGQPRTSNAERRTAVTWSVLAVTASVAGMATKESMVTAPLVVVAWDFVFARGGARRWGLYGALASTWIVLAVLLASGQRPHSVGFGFAEWPWRTYLLTQAGVVAHYLRLAIVPSPLVLDYDWPPVRSAVSVAPQILMLAGLGLATAWALAGRLPAGFAGAWFFATLAPTSSVVPIATEVAAEHRMYLPLAAIVAVVVFGVYELIARLKPRAPFRMETAGAVAIAGLVVTFAVMTDARNRDYGSYDRIWLDTIEKQPTNARARTNYASALLLRGEYAAAEPHLRAAVAAKPDFAEAHASLGVALCAGRRFDEGIPHIQRAIAIQPDYLAAHRDLGEAYAASGNLEAASRAFRDALTLKPDDVFLLTRTGWILSTAPNEEVRDGREGVRLAERAVRLTGRGDVDALDTLAAAYAEVDRFDDARAAGEEALSLARRQVDQRGVPDLERHLTLVRARQKIRE